MPDIHDQNDARLGAVVPHIVLEAIVQDENLALLPGPTAEGDGCVTGRLPSAVASMLGDSGTRAVPIAVRTEAC